jgi:hypothetical protein
MEHMTIVLSKPTTEILPHPDFINKPHIYPQTFSIPALNLPNVHSDYGNTLLYVTPIVSIVLSDGLYTINSMNKYLLSAPIGGLYFLLAPSLDGLHTLIYSFTSYSDKVNFVNYTIQPVNNLSVLNTGIYNNDVWLTSVFLKTEVVHVHSNENATSSSSLITTNTLEIPIAVEPTEN